MAYRYCDVCGQLISDVEGYCPNCGMEYDVPFCEDNSKRYKVPGRGFGIAGMILGIIGVFYGLQTLAALSFSSNAGVYAYDPAMYNEIIAMQLALFEVIGKLARVMAIMYPAIFGILALVFGIVSQRKGYMGGFGKAAVILGAISLAFCVIIGCLFFL